MSSRQEAEWLCIQLLIDGYLKETWAETAYSVNTYIEPGDKCAILTCYSREDIETSGDEIISCLFPTKSRKSAGKQKAVVSDEERASPPPSRRTSMNKRKRMTIPSSEEEEESDAEWDYGLGRTSLHKKSPTSLSKKKRQMDMDVIELSSD
jgi:ATP-dependent DNA helicase Q1